MHCVPHRTSLAAGVLQEVRLIGKVHTFVKDVSAYFSVSTKRQSALADELEGLGAKILKAVHMVITRWFVSLERVLDPYDGLVKLSVKDATNANHLYETLTNLEGVLTMHAFMPMLKVLNSFVKTAQIPHLHLGSSAGPSAGPRFGEKHEHQPTNPL